MELLSPAGDFETARVAFAAGADAVYCGLTSFSARAEARNLTLDELRQLVAYAHALGRRVYVTFNTVLDEDQLPAAVETLADLAEIGPDALIVQDLGVARIVREHFPELELHASTQLVAHNLEGVLALKTLGFTRVVLARELTAAEIASISRRCGVEIEVFIHGALCYSLSGLCLFSAMEKDRSGNRGQCAYCCRLGYVDSSGARTLPFSMKDLRLDGQLGALEDAGVASLKIEGRMKSAVYVGSVTRYYRQMLDAVEPVAKGTASADAPISRADLETVFSRRTTSLYIAGRDASCASPIDSESLGHLGAPIGKVKRVTRDREGRAWLRFHTARALEKHDGLQFLVPGGRPCGLGISAMRLALARRPVFEVPADSDVEVLIEKPDELPVAPGATVYCSSSNAVKRAFPVPPFRPSDYPAGRAVNVTVALSAAGAEASVDGCEPVRIAQPLDAARDASKTEGAVRKAFARMGESGWRLGSLSVADPEGRFAPPSVLNELRRMLTENLDDAAARRRRSRIDSALRACRPSASSEDAPAVFRTEPPRTTVKVRLDQIAAGALADCAETIVAIGAARASEIEALDLPRSVRLALPVFTAEADFNRLRTTVKHLVQAGYSKWEASDLATLRLLRQTLVADITADWTLYAFNSAAAMELAAAGVSRFVCSPENRLSNLEALLDVRLPTPEFLAVQSTPLFISLTAPAAGDPTRLTGPKGEAFTAYSRGGLWVTTRAEPRRFAVPEGAAWTRRDLSWDP